MTFGGQAARLVAAWEAAPPWQVLLCKATLLLVAAWSLDRLLASANPRWRVLLWRITAVAVVALPLLSTSLPSLPMTVLRVEKPASETTPLQRQSLTRGSPLTNPSHEPIANVSQRRGFRVNGLFNRRTVSQCAVALWLAGVGFLGLRVAFGQQRLKALLRASRQAPAEIAEACREVALKLNCRQPVRVQIHPELPAPLLAGVAQPCVVLPEKMCQAAQRAELPAVFAHELAHLQARDLFWSRVMQWLSVLFWFHPLTWRMHAAHDAATEEVSDSVAARVIGGARSYARTLARVALELAGRRMAYAAIPMARQSEVSRRVSVLMSGFLGTRLQSHRVTLVKILSCLLLIRLSSLSFSVELIPVVHSTVGLSETERNAPTRAQSSATQDRTITLEAVFRSAASGTSVPECPRGGLASPPSGTGAVLREYWFDARGMSVETLMSHPAFPQSPSGKDYPTSFETMQGGMESDFYGSRWRGYLHPPETGEYTFWIASDDQSQLYLSTDDSPNHKQRIASVPAWTPYHEWTRFPEQKSPSIHLEAGRPYYVEVLHQEGGGGDHISVAWQRRGGVIEVIQGENLSPFRP